jgi:hypothetical protein
MSMPAGLMSNVKTMATAAWVVAVGVVLVGIINQDHFLARSIPAVAEVSRSSGDVSFRSENQVRWNDAAPGTLLADGDRVATGRFSTTEIKFSDGRKLALSEESQVVVSTITHSDSGVTFLVNLVKGTVIADAKANCKKCRDIIVRAGGESFRVSKGKKEGFSRDRNTNKVERFKPGRVAAISVPEPESSESAPVTKVNDVESDKVPREQAKPVVTAAGFEYGARAPAEGLNIWTYRNVNDLFGARLNIPVVAPLKAPVGKKYVPLIEISNIEGTKKETIAGASASDSVVSLALVKIRMTATQSWTGARQYAVNIRGGVRIFDGGKPLDSIGSAKQTLTISSIGEPLGTPLALGFDRLKYENPASNWIPSKNIIPVASAPVQVTLFGAGDFARMLPFAVGAGKYGSLTGSQTAGSVANIVRDGYIVAQVNRYSSPEEVRTIARALGATFTFVGAKGLYQYSSGSSQDNVITLVDDLLDKGKVLYFYKNQKLYPVNRTFIKNSKEVANFLGKQANMFFTEKVELIN